MGCADGFAFVDKATYPARRFSAADGVRVVPGGSSVRSGAFVSKGVVMMPTVSTPRSLQILAMMGAPPVPVPPPMPAVIKAI